MSFKKYITLLSKHLIAQAKFLNVLTVVFLTGAIAIPSAHATELRGAYHQTAKQTSKVDINAIKADLNHLKRTPELVTKIDELRNSLNPATPIMLYIELDLFKLDVLSKIGDFKAAAALASKIYSENPRNNYPSEKHFGDTMFQIVESLAKTDNLGISYDIVLKLRRSVYQNPDTYLSFIVDKSLMEIYIETSDYKRALDQALSILDNPEYMSNSDIEKWRPVAINEIAYLYNQLGDGENALIYLKKASKLLTKRGLTVTKLNKAKALNYANRGRAHLLLENYNQARAMGLKVAVENKNLQQDYLKAVSHQLIGSADYHQGQYHKAMPDLKAAILLADNDNNVSLRRSLYQLYASSLESVGQHKSAIKWYKKLFTLETNLQNVMASTRSKLNDIELSALKDHQEMTHMQHELDQSKMTYKLMLITILSLIVAGTILVCLLVHMRRSQKKLVLSEQKAQDANKAKGQFLANMSHEIRTPMNGVLGMAQVLERTPLTSQQKYYLDIVKRSGGTLLALINDILDFSKIEADKLILNYHPRNLDQTLQDAVSLLDANATEKNIELRYNYDAALPKHYLIDGNRIRQIALNLIGNAIKFTEQGYVDVRVEGKVHDKHAAVIITVTDTGMGIEDDKLQMIFDKFTQADDSPSRSNGGTGLGLAISDKLTSAMNGKISVKSKFGIGSTFTVELPLEIVTPLKASKLNPQQDYPSSRVA